MVKVLSWLYLQNFFYLLKKDFNRSHLIVVILLILIISTRKAYLLFGNSTIVPTGYENLDHPLKIYLVDLTMYLTDVILSIIVVLLIPPKDIFLFLVAIVLFFLWLIDLLDFIFFTNQGYHNIKDYIILIFLISIAVFGVKTWKRNKGKQTEIVNVTNLALLKWFIPVSEAEKAFKNSQRNIELEHKLLRSQMNPHFIFNSLTAIQNYIYSEEAEVAASYLSKFSKLMRLILENSRQEYISFKKELETLELYIELQKIRFSNKFDSSIIIDPSIDIDEIAIPPMFAQPFIENSLEHGILHKNEKGQIQISFVLQDNGIRFEVEDNGVGRKRAAEINSRIKTDHTSYATTITEERLLLINEGKSEEKVITKDIFDDEKHVTGTKVCFIIPYKNI